MVMKIVKLHSADCKQISGSLPSTHIIVFGLVLESLAGCALQATSWLDSTGICGIYRYSLD